MTPPTMLDQVEAGPSTTPRKSQEPLDVTSEAFQRPPFRPVEAASTACDFISSPSFTYIPVLSHPVHFKVNHFFSAVKDLTLHPERNSSLILRADPLPARTDTVLDQELVDHGFQRHEEIRVRLMPKQVKRDGRLDQRVTFYEDAQGRAVVLKCPEVKAAEDIPFYHPTLRKLAYIYEPIFAEEVDDPASVYPIKGKITIAYVPFAPSESSKVGTSTTIPPAFLGRPARSPRKRSPLADIPSGDGLPLVSTPNDHVLADLTIFEEDKQKSAAELAEKTARICRVILERVYKHAYGRLTGYTKRVFHDVVVNRESFQDLYLVLKDRHRHLDSRVKKPSKLEDVKRHVWKLSDASLPSDPSLPLDDISHWGSQDVAIATFLMLLWRDMYPARPVPDGKEEVQEWDTWGRPPGGFVDLGCGNGLLVHILTAEGYAGKGYELRARKTWPSYPPSTREVLIEYPIAFPDWFPMSVEEWEEQSWEGREDCPIKEDCFIIGNHADEITPWMPLLSLLPSKPVPHLSLPCCFHTLDGAYSLLTYDPPAHPHTPNGGFGHGLDDGVSRYKSYLMWLGWSGLQCGWKWEKESLRVPSTKGWAIVAKSRWAKGAEDDRLCRQWALEQVQGVRDRGLFKVREKEGKDNH